MPWRRRGTPGATGATGAAGVPGGEGPEGDPGAIGPPGAAGSAGSPGAAGAAGTIGPPGADGPEGDAGSPGPPGVPGPAGTDGTPGTIGYTIPGAPGDDGDPSFVPGPPGPPGSAGADGAAGIAGVPGPPGADGDDGEPSYVPGPPGAAGSAGSAGAAGQIGPPGADGPEGDAGSPGPPGPPGAAGADGAAGTIGYTIPGPQGDEGDPSMIPGPQGPQGDKGSGFTFSGIATRSQTGTIDSTIWSANAGIDLVQWQGGAAATLVGMAAKLNGETLTIENVGFSDSFTVIDGSVAEPDGTARFNLPWREASLRIAPKQALTFVYKTSQNKWYLVGSPYGVLFVITQDLGVARRSGTFDLTGLGSADYVVGDTVLAYQTADAIASKGSARDEPEMDQIQIVGYTITAAQIRFYWHCANVVVGTYSFAYRVTG